MKKLILCLTLLVGIPLICSVFVARVFAQSVNVSAPVFSGTGLNDASSQGPFTALPTNASFYAQITDTGTPDRFTWTQNGGPIEFTFSSGSGTTLTVGNPAGIIPGQLVYSYGITGNYVTAVSGSIVTLHAAVGPDWPGQGLVSFSGTVATMATGWNALANGVQIKWAATTGHALGANWTIGATSHGSAYNMNYLSGGNAAATQNDEQRNRKQVWVTDYVPASASGSGADVSAYAQSALDAAIVAGVPLYIPGGLPYNICRLVYNGTADVTIRGDGKFRSFLQRPSSCAQASYDMIDIATTGHIEIVDVGMDAWHNGVAPTSATFSGDDIQIGQAQVAPASVNFSRNYVAHGQLGGFACQPCRNVTMGDNIFYQNIWQGASIASVGTTAAYAADPPANTNFSLAIHNNLYIQNPFGLELNFFQGSINDVGDVFYKSTMAITQNPGLGPNVTVNIVGISVDTTPDFGCVIAGIFFNAACGTLPSAYGGIHMEGVSGAHISGGYFANLTNMLGAVECIGSILAVPESGSGLLLQLPCSHNTIDSSTFENISTPGVSFGGFSLNETPGTQNAIRGNHFRNFSAGSSVIQIAGSSCDVEDNNIDFVQVSGISSTCDTGFFLNNTLHNISQGSPGTYFGFLFNGNPSFIYDGAQTKNLYVRGNSVINDIGGLGNCFEDDTLFEGYSSLIRHDHNYCKGGTPWNPVPQVPGVVIGTPQFLGTGSITATTGGTWTASGDHTYLAMITTGGGSTNKIAWNKDQGAMAFGAALISTTALTVSSVAGTIHVGDYVFGPAMPPGQAVAAISGTSVTLTLPTQFGLQVGVQGPLYFMTFSTPANITGSPQAITDGITMTFSGTTGGVFGDVWVFGATDQVAGWTYLDQLDNTNLTGLAGQTTGWIFTNAGTYPWAPVNNLAGTTQGEQVLVDPANTNPAVYPYKVRKEFIDHATGNPTTQCFMVTAPATITQTDCTLEGAAVVVRDALAGTEYVRMDGRGFVDTIAAPLVDTPVGMHSDGSLYTDAAIAGINQLTGDGTAGPGSGSQVLTLANAGVSAGTYGDAAHVPAITFDTKGRATSAVSTPIVLAGASVTDTFVTAISGTFVTGLSGSFLTSCTLTPTTAAACSNAGCTSTVTVITAESFSCTSGTPGATTGSPGSTTGSGVFLHGLHQ